MLAHVQRRRPSTPSCCCIMPAACAPGLERCRPRTSPSWPPQRRCCWCGGCCSCSRTPLLSTLLSRPFSSSFYVSAACRRMQQAARRAGAWPLCPLLVAARRARAAAAPAQHPAPVFSVSSAYLGEVFVECRSSWTETCWSSPPTPPSRPSSAMRAWPTAQRLAKRRGERLPPRCAGTPPPFAGSAGWLTTCAAAAPRASGSPPTSRAACLRLVPSAGRSLGTATARRCTWCTLPM